jgi:hypothetical protein
LNLNYYNYLFSTLDSSNSEGKWFSLELKYECKDSLLAWVCA